VTDTLTEHPDLHTRGREALLHEPAGGDPDKLTLVKASGSLVWDDTGQGVHRLHRAGLVEQPRRRRPPVIEAAIEQTGNSPHAPPDLPHPALLELAELMVSIAPAGLDRVGFTLHGSMAVEMALKLAMRNRPDAKHIAVLHDRLPRPLDRHHGASWPHPGNVFGPLQPQFLRLPRPDPVTGHAGVDHRAGHRAHPRAHPRHPDQGHRGGRSPRWSTNRSRATAGTTSSAPRGTGASARSATSSASC